MSASRKAGAKSPPMKTNLDDWETDPDFVRDMDETDQRWGAKRTVGSINMNELIDEVRKDHKIMREKFVHPSQRDHSEGFGGKFGIQHDRKDQSAQDYDYHEELSKHTSQEISRKVITSSSGSDNGISDAKRTFLERKGETFEKSRPNLGPKPAEFRSTYSSSFKPSTTTTSANIGDRFPSSTSPKFEESSSMKRIFSEKSSSSSASARGPNDLPPAFKSIQEKIDAFKKEFEDIENKVNKKSDLSKVIKKSTNVEKSSNVEYVSRNDPTSPKSAYATTSNISGGSSRPSSTSPSKDASTSSRLYSQRADLPKANIKSLSEKFETLCREDSEDFRRRTEAKRKEFFNEIKNQVRETRKELDGFDPIDEDYDQIIERKVREQLQSRASQSSPSRASPGSGTGALANSNARFTATPSPSSRSSSRLGGGNGSQLSQSSSSRPKVYTKRETTQEKYVSKFVKEGDKVIVDETQRNVERSSSVHGSSDEDPEEPSSIKFIERELRTSPVAGTESPVDRLRREIPIVEPEIKGGGLMARTLYDYQAAEEDELSFDVDDLITNIEKIDAGWYKGTIVYKDGRKRTGLFPANYVRLLNDASEY